MDTREATAKKHAIITVQYKHNKSHINDTVQSAHFQCQPSACYDCAAFSVSTVQGWLPTHNLGPSAQSLSRRSTGSHRHIRLQAVAGNPHPQHLLSWTSTHTHGHCHTWLCAVAVRYTYKQSISHTSRSSQTDMKHHHLHQFNHDHSDGVLAEGLYMKST